MNTPYVDSINTLKLTGVLAQNQTKFTTFAIAPAPLPGQPPPTSGIPLYLEDTDDQPNLGQRIADAMTAAWTHWPGQLAWALLGSGPVTANTGPLVTLSKPVLLEIFHSRNVPASQ
jgi:hypothetical protein